MRTLIITRELAKITDGYDRVVLMGAAVQNAQSYQKRCNDRGIPMLVCGQSARFYGLDDSYHLTGFMEILKIIRQESVFKAFEYDLLIIVTVPLYHTIKSAVDLALAASDVKFKVAFCLSQLDGQELSEPALKYLGQIELYEIPGYSLQACKVPSYFKPYLLPKANYTLKF